MAHTAGSAPTINMKNMKLIKEKLSPIKQKGTSINLKTMIPAHYPALYEIHRRTHSPNCGSFEEFKKLFDTRSGFVVRMHDRIIGAISFSDWIPEHDITIHCFIDPDYHGKWALCRRHYRSVFDYCFIGLQLKRVSGFCIPGISDAAGRMLLGLGFKDEGMLRQKIKYPDGKIYDIKLYGLLRKEQKGDTSCQWYMSQ